MSELLSPYWRFKSELLINPHIWRQSRLWQIKGWDLKVTVSLQLHKIQTEEQWVRRNDERKTLWRKMEERGKKCRKLKREALDWQRNVAQSSDCCDSVLEQETCIKKSSLLSFCVSVAWVYKSWNQSCVIFTHTQTVGAAGRNMPVTICMSVKGFIL